MRPAIFVRNYDPASVNHNHKVSFTALTTLNDEDKDMKVKT